MSVNRNSLSLTKSMFVTIVTASTCLMAVFTYIHLTREADVMTERQIRESELVIELTKARLNPILHQNSGTLPEKLTAPIFQEIYHSMRGAALSIALLRLDGSFLYPAGQINPHERKDAERIQSLSHSTAMMGRSFEPLPSLESKDALDIMVPITLDGRMVYALKTTVTLDTLKSAFYRTYGTIIFIFTCVLMFSVYLGLHVSRRIIQPIKALVRFSERVSNGAFSERVKIDTGNEIQDLADALNHMTHKLGRMKNVAEDSNPLTHLPGNNAIASEITKRLDSGAKTAVMHCDLDRFKIYNDLYGIRRGDEVIKMTAEALKEAVHESGGGDDVVAHEGGDDFVVITVPSRVKGIAEAVIRIFDSRIGQHYRTEDRLRQSVLIKGRRKTDLATEEKVPLPLMSISIAAVRSDTHPFASYSEIATALVDMKKKAKGIKGSSFAVLD